MSDIPPDVFQRFSKSTRDLVKGELVRFLKSRVNHVSLMEEEERAVAASSPRALLFFVANSPRIALRRSRKPHLYSVDGVGRIGGALSGSRQMRCFKKRKGVNARAKRDRARNGEMNKKEWKTAVQEQEIPRISYAGGCFAWPRQYYYHIFRIMRSHVCLLFHATPSRYALSRRGAAGNVMHFNVLSFRCSFHVSLYTICDAPTKSLCATAAQELESAFDSRS